MSGPATTSPADPFADRVIPLLKEYADKLNRIKTEATKAKDLIAESRRMGLRVDNVRLDDLRDKLQTLTPPAKSLAQHVSQKLEHGALDDLDRLELWLRLAEFENALLSAEKALQATRT